MAFTPPALDTLEPIQQPQAAPTPTTHYSQGRSVGGPDEMEDRWTNQGYTATGKNLTEGVVAVNPKVYPLGTILRDEDTGENFLAADRHGNDDPNVVDIYQAPGRYTRESKPRRLAVAGRLEKIPTTAEGVRRALADFGGQTPRESTPSSQGQDPTGGGYFTYTAPDGTEVRRPQMIVRPEPVTPPAETFTPPALDTLEPDPILDAPRELAAPANAGFVANLWNSFAKGATSEGVYSGLEGASRVLGTSLQFPDDEQMVRQADGTYKANLWKAMASGIGELAEPTKFRL